MKVNLTIEERIITLGILNQFKGNLLDVKIVSDCLPAISMDKAEQEEVEYKVIEGQSITWNSAKAKDKEVELPEQAVNFILKIIDDKDEKQEFTLADKSLLSIKEKLSVKE